MSRAFSSRLEERGAEAVVLCGSWVRGDAYAESDVDIIVIGRGPCCRLERFQGFLVSASWATATQHRHAFKDPGKAGGIIPAWRNARIIYDPLGTARILKREACGWRWNSLGRRVDRWVAEELSGYAEEVHRLVGNLRLGRRGAAAVQRSVLAICMAQVLAVHHRILYESENPLWALVSERMGAMWAQAQSAALGEGGQSFEDSCNAALRLFALAAQEAKQVLNQRQYEVVAHACDIAGQPLQDRNMHPKRTT